MKKENSLALIIAFYLSKFNIQAYKNLGYSTFIEAFRKIGKKLNVKSSTIKNMRDEFDTVNPNNRVGWYQRELLGSRKQVLDLYGNFSEKDLKEFVLEILKDHDSIDIAELDNIQVIKTGKRKSTISLRGPTGFKAEEFFKNNYLQYFKGAISDKRVNACGYDFEIENLNGKLFIEVKGLAGLSGGIEFTNKEWETAQKQKELYILAIVKNVKKSPLIHLIINPYKYLQAKTIIVKTSQIKWIVSDKMLKKHFISA